MQGRCCGKDGGQRRRALRAGLHAALFCLLTVSRPVDAGGTPAAGDSPLRWKVSGYIKSQNSVAVDDLPWQDMPADGSTDLDSINRLRLNGSVSKRLSTSEELLAVATIDSEPAFSSDFGSGLERMRKYLLEERQSADLVKTFDVSGDAELTEAVYRGYLMYRGGNLTAAVGRQQIPWGVAYFFTPTDVFNPIFPTQLDWDERPGVDALWIQDKVAEGTALQFVYTPPGRDLHPQRFMARVSHEFELVEVGLLGGWVDAEATAGMDARATVGDSAFRAECLHSALADGDEFDRCSVNADHNFPGNIYGSIEFHYNGAGARSKSSYGPPELYGGGLLPLARDYLAFMLGHDVTPLVRVEFSHLINLVDSSSYLRPQGKWSVTDNTSLTSGALLYTGGSTDEYGIPGNLYFVEGQYSF